MPPQGRLGDKSRVPVDAHGCPACPHTAIGPAITGSQDVLVNFKPALRVGDMGLHAVCCGPNTWVASEGSSTVFINYRKAHRKGDSDRHCGGSGFLVDGSPDVIVGNDSADSVSVSLSCTQIQTLKKASEAGTPFCEVCES